MIKYYYSILLFSFACTGFLSALDYPEITTKYEIQQGSDEDEIEDYLLPSSMRNSISVRLKEHFSNKLWNAVLLKYSIKDYYNKTGDYSYFNLNNELSWKISSSFKMGVNFLSRWVYFADPDTNGQPKNYVTIGGKLLGLYKILPGLAFNTWMKANYNLYKDVEKSREEYTVSIGLKSKWNKLSWNTKYRGVLREPLGKLSAQDSSFLNYGSVTATWKPE